MIYMQDKSIADGSEPIVMNTISIHIGYITMTS